MRAATTAMAPLKPRASATRPATSAPADTGFRARHATSFERVAVVSDEDWVRPALRALSALLPRKARGFRVQDLEAAEAWVAEGLTS